MQRADTFSIPVSEEILQHTIARLQERNIGVLVVENGDEARKLVAERVPKGAEIHWGKSKTLQDAGIIDLFQNSGEYDALQPRYLKMDRKTQGREIRKLTSAPDFMLGSVNALTEDGILMIASATASQLGALANGAGKVIFVVGSQKIVPNMEMGMRRIREYVLPWEDEQVRKTVPSGSFVGKILIIEREWVAERVTVILVRETIGI